MPLLDALSTGATWHKGAGAKVFLSQLATPVFSIASPHVYALCIHQRAALTVTVAAGGVVGIYCLQVRPESFKDYAVAIKMGTAV